MEHTEDLAADFLRFFNVHLNPFEYDFGGLTGPHYYSFCYRIAAYDGVMARVIEAEHEKAKNKSDLDSPSIQTDATGKRVQGTSANDWFKTRHKKSSAPVPRVSGELSVEDLIKLEEQTRRG